MARSRRRRQRPAEPDSGSVLERFSITSLLFVGLVVGLAGGLYYAWIVAPVVYVAAGPARFSQQYKVEYIYLVSQSYAIEGNWDRAQQRLAALDDPEIAQTVAGLLETYLRQQKPADQIQNLAQLAQQLGAQGAAVALFAPTPLSGAATSTPTTPPVLSPTATATATSPPTQAPLPTLTATATPRPSATPRLVYRLLSQQRVCSRASAAPLIEVITQDALLEPLPGVEVLVTWDRGSDHFFTGFKPELGPGYGDFTMSPDVSYTVRIAEGSPEVSGLRTEPCSNGVEGGWELVFQNLILRTTATPEP
jgi:hypothetical protein